MAKFSAIWVLCWFDWTEMPERRAILQMHPRRDPADPVRGMFATRAPVRSNLIALSRCGVLSARDNIIEVDEIDAFADSPLSDAKPLQARPPERQAAPLQCPTSRSGMVPGSDRSWPL